MSICVRVSCELDIRPPTPPMSFLPLLCRPAPGVPKNRHPVLETDKKSRILCVLVDAFKPQSVTKAKRTAPYIVGDGRFGKHENEREFFVATIIAESGRKKYGVSIHLNLSSPRVVNLWLTAAQ